MRALQVVSRKTQPQFEKAKTELDQAVSDHPERYEAYLVRAEFYQRHREETALQQLFDLEGTSGVTTRLSIIQKQINEDAQQALGLSLPEFGRAETDLIEAEECRSGSG